ncbi:MAG TPA: HAD-IIIA family hydrolase [Opitutaceae bacterium]|jgi:D-glycero-D-manno-heptose 1,7-bisphosphate phosphatase|nr:HAD-IIIA family hydrolase [Opitutaceae bacterium]
MPQRPAVFLDRDGTLNVTVVRDGKPYAPDRLEDFHLLDGVAQDCQALKKAGYVLVIATNQPDVGRGKVAQSVIESMHAKLLAEIPSIDRIEVSYDPGRGEVAPRRKPGPGMLLDAAKALDLDLTRSWMVGDRWRDVQCGQAAGVRTVLIECGYNEGVDIVADQTVNTFHEAVGVILANSLPA